MVPLGTGATVQHSVQLERIQDSAPDVPVGNHEAGAGLGLPSPPGPSPAHAAPGLGFPRFTLGLEYHASTGQRALPPIGLDYTSVSRCLKALSGSVDLNEMFPGVQKAGEGHCTVAVWHHSQRRISLGPKVASH